MRISFWRPSEGVAEQSRGMARSGLIWGLLLIAVTVPIGIAAMSPLLAWRDPVYIIAGFAGVVALALLLVQPVLISGALAGRRGPSLHRWTGGALAAAVIIHVAGLWITSPPDVIDALLMVSPTPFSIWGVFAMWAVLASACLATFRRRLRWRPRTWRRAHMALAVVSVVGTVVHAVLIQGTMGMISKIALCVLVLAATAWVIAGRWRRRAL